MNVIGSRADKWWNDPDRAVRDMTRALDEYAARSGRAMTLVLDKDPGSLPSMEHVEVLVARRRGRNAADFEIERIVADAADPSALIVVTSDKRLVDKVTSLGAHVTGAGTFRRMMDAR